MSFHVVRRERANIFVVNRQTYTGSPSAMMSPSRMSDRRPI
jgi:hypothetical protein